jgi:predicted Zn-dependent peptidase
MIKFEKFTLDNGLKVIYHEDRSTPLVCVDVLYDVGARDESPDKTGFAHLFEHLMFGGSANIPSFDEPLQRVGGDNNAFTTNDITNYYITLPAVNAETAFWLESDRMMSLAFSEKSLEVQRNVVVEEFKQRYLNQPYGDVWLLLRPLVYKTHPYQWPTIGKELSHIENATMDDVKKFFFTHYAPNNAILVVAGNISLAEVKALCEKWFAPIEKRAVPVRNLPKEPVQIEERKLSVYKDVPYDALYKAYHICARRDKDYHAYDLLSDILSNGRSSRLYKALVKEKKLFTEINAYLTGDLDEGLFVIQGKLLKGVTYEQAEQAIAEEIRLMQENLLESRELEKVKNKVESILLFSEMNILNKAMNLATAELLGDASLINKETELYRNVTAEDIRRCAAKSLIPQNCSTLYYHSNTPANG